MTQDEIFRLAREAHLEALTKGKGIHIWHDNAFIGDVKDFCVCFAQMIASHEREACAKIADTWKNNVSWEGKTAADNIANQIRARGNA